MKTSKRYVKPMSADEGANLDWSKAVQVDFPNLRPSTKSISLRLPVSMLNRLKVEANRRDVPYQSYIKVLLADALKHTA